MSGRDPMPRIDIYDLDHRYNHISVLALHTPMAPTQVRAVPSRRVGLRREGRRVANPRVQRCRVITIKHQHLEGGAYWRAPCRVFPRFALRDSLSVENLKGSGSESLTLHHLRAKLSAGVPPGTPGIDAASCCEYVRAGFARLQALVRLSGDRD